eukprot:2962713-Rhodomonas_salina.2
MTTTFTTEPTSRPRCPNQLLLPSSSVLFVPGMTVPDSTALVRSVPGLKEIVCPSFQYDLYQECGIKSNALTHFFQYKSICPCTICTRPDSATKIHHEAGS